MPETKEFIERAYTIMREAGLNPFDLMEWRHLLDVHKGLKSDTFLDRNVRESNLRKAESALRRMAETLDRERGDIFASTVLLGCGMQKTSTPG